MTPSHPLRVRAWIFGFVSVVVIAGCAGSPSSSPPGDESPPPKVKQPPSPKAGSRTVPGCDGIPESGRCEDRVAVSCDLTAGALRRKDCGALEKSCVLDGQRGAVCEVVTPPAPGSAPSTCDTGVTFEGTCSGTGGQTAIWCDPDTNQTISWDCTGDNLSCETDGCAAGAFCCNDQNPPLPSDECPMLGFFGECGGADGTTARWCDGNELIELPCTGSDTCQIDACADGAYCCPPSESECAQIGIRGVCGNNGNVRWCSNGTVTEEACPAGEPCQLDTCGDGAFCCAP